MATILTAGGIAGALLALSGLAIMCGRLFRWGVREAVEPDMTSIKGRLSKIEAEFNPNHGTSFHDKIIERLDRIEAQGR